ncbi:T-cell surface glycoprotein CD3 gamma chain-like [Rhinoderma darwinii]|uniref:T-cell surface glycoprotein CD3 gamma chain-like n=1 Tax=Rhinoderma darwinii TaxID=43563 RepID=UPI003F661742
MVTSRFWLSVTLFIIGVFAQDNVKDENIMVVEKGDNLYLKCSKDCKWFQDDVIVANGTDLLLGSLWNDPRGVYYRANPKDRSKREYIHVYVRRCMNCIELEPGTIAGFIVADVIMIGLIAMAVYFVSDSEIRRPGRASDKQNLIEKDSEYQILRQRDNDQYSYLASRPKRGGF